MPENFRRILHEMFIPNQKASTETKVIRGAIYISVISLLWFLSSEDFPRPLGILNALRILWFQEGLGRELFSSFSLIAGAVVIATIISLTLSYLKTIEFCRPLVTVAGNARFLSTAGFVYLFTKWFPNGHDLKRALLVLVVSGFFIKCMSDVVSAITKAQFDHARTVRMNEFRIVWEVVVLGTIHNAFDVLQQNWAMGWAMITMVEGMVRSEGGVGGLLLNSSRHFDLDAMFAIQITFFILGYTFDKLIPKVKAKCCPYAISNLERRA